MKQPTETRAFLAWFLEHYYHLDEIEIQDCICDKSHDKGIDGIYVNKAVEQIDVFQNDMSKNPSGASIGDVDLKTFQGSLLQFQSADSIRKLEASTQINPELKALLRREKIADKIDEGYTLRGVYLTNRTKGSDATDYLRHNPNIILWDVGDLNSNYIPIDKVSPIAKGLAFDVRSLPCMEYDIDKDIKMVIAPLAAKELIKMEGIVSGELFAPNVRYWLGKSTPVNRGIAESIVKRKEEHKYFPAFHNGLIILCDTLKRTKNKITISGYAVVNGCQSLKGLFDNAKHITSDLKILTKFICVSSNEELVKQITYRSNNQNATKSRDLQSNSTTQNRLQSAINSKYAGQYFYRISRGESPELDKNVVIENTLAGQLLLAFDLKRPESSHLVDAKIFADWHGDIFGRPEVDADRIVALNELFQSAVEQLGILSDKGFASYTLTRFLLVYLIREALELDPTGMLFCENPSPFLRQTKGIERLRYCFSVIAKILVRQLDSHFKRRNKAGEFFDYKSELKNPQAVEKISDAITLGYQYVLDDDETKSFSSLWAKSESEV